VANGIPLSPFDPLYIHSDSGYSPEVLSDMQSAEVTFDPSQYPPSQGIGDLGAFQQIGAYLRGVSEWPETIGNYFIRPDERNQPSFISGEELGRDIAGLGRAIVEGAREDPLGTIADMTPIVGETRAVRSANNLIKQALAAEDAGDFDKASTLRQLASMEMTSVLPFVSRAAVKRRGIWDDDRRHDPHEPEADRRQRERTLARQRRKQEEERRQQESDARREPPPTPQEPSPTVQDSLFSDVRFSTDQNAPGMPFETWNMINDPEHFIKSRGKITNIEQMSPSEYISRVSRDVFPTFGEAAIRQQRERTGQIPSIMQAMEEGTEFGLPMIHYDQGGSRFPTQEGLHRAMAAERLGISEIPVAIHQLDRSPAARAARAEEFGFTTDVYHGTRSDFSEFDPSEVDIGVHVGSSEQATNRLLDISEGSNLYSLGTVGQGIGRLKGRFDQGSQVMPLKARMTNTLELSDVGEWKNSFNVIDELIENPHFEHKLPELRELRKWAEKEGPAWRDEYGNSTWDTSPQNREALDELNRMISD